jgi:hypothetical protein
VNYRSVASALVSSLSGCATLLTVALPLLASPGTALAQEAPPAEAQAEPKIRYSAIGSPANPKVDVRWNRYHDYAEATAILERLAAAYPEYTKLQSLGESYEGRKMHLLTIADPEGSEPIDRRPAFWIDAGIHANEIQVVETALYTAWWLLEMRDESEFVQRLLRERTFYILPMMSPDSRDAHMYEPNTTHSPRTGQRPIDDDNDGRVDEDPADDLDGDGNLTQMRVRDPNGEYKVHPKYSHRMIPAEKQDPPEVRYRLLGQEGFDNDDDGRVNEDGDGSYDPNRDWPWAWQPEYVQNGAWRYPLAVPENRMVADFIVNHPQIAGAQTYHNAGGMLLRGPGAKSDAYARADIAVYDRFGKAGERILPGYRYINVAEDLYEVYGGELDWLHQARGIFAFNNELFTSFNYFREGGGSFFGSNEEIDEFDERLLLGEGFTPWKEVDHPDYGKVEVGGQKKNWSRQPPGFLLEEEAHRNMAFTLLHADQMPLVGVQSVETKRLDDRTWEVTAIVENPKWTPTRSQADLDRNITPPDLVKIAGDDLEVAVAQVSDEPFFRSPDVQEVDPATVRLPRLPGESVRYVRWIVVGEGEIAVSIESVKGGTDRKTAKLEAVE